MSGFKTISSHIEGAQNPVDWIIPDFIPRGSLIALAGVPGAGKSFLAYTLSLALSSGGSALGWDFSPTKILYFDQENSPQDAAQYLRWAWIGLNRPDLSLADQNFILASHTLGDHRWAETARGLVLAYQPSLIIIDTTTPCCAVQDENDNAEATNIINKLRQIQASIQPAPSIIALKHAKVDNESGKYTLRGAKAWEGAVDGVVYHVRNEGRPRADGLRITRLVPAKTRAFGLRTTLSIHPEWIEEGQGLKLSRIDTPGE